MSVAPRLAAGLAMFTAVAAPTLAQTLEFDPVRGSVQVVTYGREDAPRFDGSPAEVARRFVDENRRLFNGRGADQAAGITDSFLGLPHTRADEGEAPEVRVDAIQGGGDVSYVRLRQQVQGIDVAGADVVVAVRNDGSVSSAQGGYVSAAHRGGVARVASRLLGDDAALEAVREDLASRSETLELGASQAARLVWWTDADGKLVKAYEVDQVVETPRGDWRYHVDASTGKVLARQNLLRFAHGHVYMSNPMRDPDLVEVQLENLDGSGKLKGSAVRVTNGKASEIVAQDGNFTVDTDDTHFAEVMAYFHIDRIHSNLKNIDPAFTGMDWQIPIEVHSKGSFFMRNDNAFYSPFKKAMFILDPKKLNDLHLEAGVAYHEYHHAVTDNIVPGLSSTEGRAMHEGYSDYFACALTDDPEIGEWALEPLGRPNMRDLRSERHYPEDLHPNREPHSDGEIWAAACWDLREKLGGAIADFLVHKSRFYISGSATFKSAYEGMLQADQDHNGGANQAAIREVFEGRGIAGETASEGGAALDVVALKQRLAFGKMFGLLN